MKLSNWCSQILGVVLTEDEAEVFLAAAFVLLPASLHADLATLEHTPAIHQALRDLFARSGQAPLAPTAMPEHPLSPGIFGTWAQQLLAVLIPARRRP